MTRMGRLAVAGLALCAAATISASGRAETSEKRDVQIVHRGGGGGYLGVQLEDVAKDDVSRLKLDTERGARVNDVVEGSPAAEAGLKPDDVVVRFQGESVHSAAQLARLVAETPAGRAVTLEVLRDGTSERMSLTLGERKRRAWSLPNLDLDIPTPPEPPAAPEAPQPPAVPHAPDLSNLHDLIGGALDFEGWGRPPRRLGIGYQEVSDQLARYFKLPGETGVLVSHVDENGPADQAGVKAGDLILEFAGKTIQSGRDLRDAVREAEGGQEVSVKVQRDGRPLDLKVMLPRPDRDERRARGVTL